MPEILPKIWGINANSGRWLEIVAVKLPGIMSGLIILENILSKRVLEWLVILVGCKIKGINELEAGESKNSLVWLCSLWFKRLTLTLFRMGLFGAAHGWGLGGGKKASP